MTEKTEMTTQEQNKAVQPASNNQPEMVIRPGVDIFEDESGITLHADMPGVSKESLSVHVEGDVLSIKGEANIPIPEGMEPLYAEVRANRYERSFTLSNEMDTDKVEANLKNGVLSLRIPKRDEHKPKKIQVQVA